MNICAFTHQDANLFLGQKLEQKKKTKEFMKMVLHYV